MCIHIVEDEESSWQEHRLVAITNPHDDDTCTIRAMADNSRGPKDHVNTRILRLCDRMDPCIQNNSKLFAPWPCLGALDFQG